MKTEVVIRFDSEDLGHYTDEFLAVLWHVAQANPADISDPEAGDVAERVGREIIRRWLAAAPVALWNHQGRHAGTLARSQNPRGTP